MNAYPYIPARWSLPLAFAILGLGVAFRSAGAEPGPSFCYQAYNVGSGLSHNSAGVLRQTRDGYLWIATDVGLARFDGVRFTNYRVAIAPGLADNLIRCLYEDRSGTLWIGTQRGLSRMVQGTIELVGMPRIAVTSLTQDRTGRIWIATLGQGLWMYRDGRAIVFSDPLLPATGENRDVRSLFTDSAGRVWMWIRNKGVACLEDDRLHLYVDSLLGRAQEFMESPRGTLWLGTNTGLLRLRGHEVTPFGPSRGLPEEQIRALYVDQRGQVWSAVNNSLYRLPDPENAESGVFVAVPFPVADYSFRTILQDHEGSYWVGSSVYGIARMQPSGFRTISAEGLLPNGVVRTVAVDAAGNVWAGLPERGAIRIAPDGKTTVVDLGVDARAEVWSVLPAADGSVWIGARGALYVWRDGHLDSFPRIQRTRALFQDRTGAIWIGAETGGGVVRYQNGTFTAFDSKINLPATVSDAASALPFAYTFAEDAQGAIYAGLLRRGFIRLKDGAVTRYETDTGFPASDVRAIFPEPDGTLWVGTRGSGLLVLDHGRWLHSDALSEPFNDEVTAILEDHLGRLWLGTPKGIMWAPKAELLAVARGERSDIPFHLAGSSEGIEPGAVGAGYTPAAWQASDGTLWFATSHGLIKADPKILPSNSVVPPVRIERILVNDRPLAHADSIELPAGNRSLTIEYTAMSFVRPAEVRFRYRMEGLDADWTNAGARRTAFFTNIPPGHYRFQVIACNDDGVWNKVGAGLPIVQQPFFYQTAWFWSMVAVGLAFGAMGLYRLRTAALRRSNERLQRRIAERTAALAERTTELAKSYETIRASEYFYHSLVESLPQIIVRKDAVGRFTYANAAFGELVGRPVAEIVGQQDQDIYPADDVAKSRADDLRVMQTGQVLEYENVVERPGEKKRYLQVKKVPLFDQHKPIGVLILFWDMTVFRETEEQLRHAQRELIETSRLAGIAEVATGVLHNLGNALNSVNTSATIAADRLRNSRAPGVGKVAQLLLDQGDRLVEFFATDPRGRQLPAYLEKLGSHLQAERSESVRELEALQANVDHIKQIVAAQQSFAHVSGIVEVVPPAEMVEYALRISEASLARHQITVLREFSPAPSVRVERHKVMQILVNLIRNAKESLTECGRADKRLVLGVRTSPEGRVQIYATDNGVGIDPEHLTQIFAFGFTTKVTGHGFGLHSSALAAKELGGSLQARSDGPGQGATFLLELPAEPALPPNPTH